MMLLLMMLTATTAWAATVQFPIYSGDEGTSGKPYQIKTIDDLNKLAADVNSGTNYEGKYFRLENDLDFYEATNTALRPTTAWDDATSQENNYTAIGLYSGTTANRRYFCGHFDGNGMTIRGIRIYSTETSKGFGLFGLIGSGAEVKNVVLDEARIAGGGYSAGIVGWNEGGTIDACQATAKVAVVGTRPNDNTPFLGGIVGRNGINGSSTPDGSTVKNCTSSVTISYIGSEKSRYCGGIAGFNKGTMTDNFVIGANICEAQRDYHGAIVGHSNSTGTTVQCNYYRDCTVAGVANAIDKGCENSNITADDGAMPVFTLTMGTGITTTTTATVTYSGTSYYVFGKAITLSGGLDNVGSFAPGYTAGYATTSGSVSGNATDGFILTMGYGDATVSASNRYPIDWAMESTGDDADHAYMIYNPEQLDLLAQRVNNGEDYAGKFFKLGANIAYAHKAANEEGADTENNYTAIGNYISSSHPFNGTFLGQNHVVSGIRIYKSGSNSAASRQGLFGYVGKTGVVSNVIVTDARIVGYGQLGVIAGSVFYNSSLSHNYYFNCTVRTATTGIGCNGADITDNDGAVSIHTLTLADGITAEPTPVFTISGTPYYSPGTTITLSYNGTLPTGCIHDYIVTKDGTDPAETVEVAESNGVYSFTMPASNVTVTSNTIQCHTLTLADGITATPTPTITVGSTPYYRPGTTVALSYTGTLPEGYGPVYTMTKDGTSDVVTTPGTFSMPASNVTISVTVTDLWGVSADPAADGSADHPYVITNAAGLDLLAQRVNGGEDYYGKYFKLMNDIAYPYATAWNAADSQENNFTRIGTGGEPFGGTFDGQGHTISGIRIYSSDLCQGLFGNIHGTVRNVTLADARITGKENVGGIAGANGGTIENCHVTANVLIGATGDNTYNHGGIAGQNHGTVDGCTSSATLSQAQECGGIVGCNEYDKSVVKNCLAMGVTIYGDDEVGAIVGFDSGGTLSHNYYSGCTVGGNTSGIGCNDGDVTANDGAVPGTLHTLTLASDITATGIMVNQGGTISVVDGTTVTLSYNGTSPTGCIHDYIVNGTVISGNTFNMPAEDVTVTSNTIQCHTLTLADGITATPTPTITVGSTPYYRPGTTVALSYTGTLPEGYGPVYTMTKDGTSDVVTTPGTFSMPASNVTISVTVTDLWGVSADPAADGSADHPYVITNAAGLDLLAQRVNGGEDYYGKYFKLMNDIAYPYATAWNAADSQENNFTRIGTGGEPFGGTFDGQGHTISGIRIYSSDHYQGLFGYVTGGCVRNVILADARITGQNFVGGIAGYKGGTIENCHVTANVLIGSTGDNPSRHGGIAGYNEGTVDGCTSSATLSQAIYCGGIVGYNINDDNVVMNCLAMGVTIYGNSSVGAIAGNNFGTLSHNYYSGFTVNGKTSGIGCGISIGDITNDGAVEATILSDAASVPTDLIGKVAFRREFTGGKASTVIFPFDYEKGTEGTYYTFGGVTYDGNKGKWIATMNEYTGTTLSANTPYLFVPAGTEAHKPVLFHGEAAASISAGTTTNGNWQFKGVYAEKTWAAADCGRDYGFAATSGKATDGATDVEAGDFVMLAEGAHIKPLRSYLTYTGSDNPWATTNAPAHRASTGDMPASISVVLVSADGSTTKITTTDFTDLTDSDGAWYTLSGTRLNGKPSAKGLYIHNGKKVVIN